MDIVRSIEWLSIMPAAAALGHGLAMVDGPSTIRPAQGLPGSDIYRPAVGISQRMRWRRRAGASSSTSRQPSQLADPTPLTPLTRTRRLQSPDTQHERMKRKACLPLLLARGAGSRARQADECCWGRCAVHALAHRLRLAGGWLAAGCAAACPPALRTAGSQRLLPQSTRREAAGPGDEEKLCPSYMVARARPVLRQRWHGCRCPGRGGPPRA